MFENIIPISDVPKKIPIAEKTLRNWRYNRKVFVDLDELERLVKRQKAKNDKK